MARDHLVVSGHYYASTAAFVILEAGGNAVAAGVAAGIATNVLQSEFTGFGMNDCISLILAYPVNAHDRYM